MWLIHTALRRPVTILMVIVGIALASTLAVRRMKADIFPELGTPVVYVAHPYGGMDPAPDGRVSGQLLRVSLPLYQRD